MGAVTGKPSTHNMPESVGPAPPCRRSTDARGPASKVVSSRRPLACRSMMSSLTWVAGGGPAMTLPSAIGLVVVAVNAGTSRSVPLTR